MSTTVWPPLAPVDLIREEEATAARELQWLLSSLQDTFISLKSGLEECEALLAPVEPGSTLVVSSSRSECVKGLITRIGTRIVKADIQLRFQTLPPPNRAAASYPLKLATDKNAPSLILGQLSTVRNLVNQSLDIVDISTWTGDAQDANFISGQLRLLAELVQEARQTLKGGGEGVANKWWESPMDENTFDPPLPSTLSVDLSIYEASIIFTFRTLHYISSSNTPTSTSFVGGIDSGLSGLSLRQRLGLASRLPEHDESELTFVYNRGGGGGHGDVGGSGGRGGGQGQGQGVGQGGQEVKVRVREKMRVESQDPSLMAVMAKLSALEHGVGVARRSLAIVMGIGEDEEEED